MEFMRNVPDKYYDLCLVDPPYGIGVNVNMGRRKGDKKSDYHKFEGEDKSIPTAEYFTELFRISQNQIIWGGNYMTEHLPPSPCWLIWDKGFSEDVTFAQIELAWTSFASSAKKFYKHPNQLNRIHPTQKPVALYKWLLTKYAKQGDKIFDSHGGSMSIAIACHDLNFDLDVCELDAEYYEQALKRLHNHQLQTKLF
jgi:site-specific DNA-methyltransferase (adenine-specific)